MISSHLYIHVEIGDLFKKVRVFLHELFLKICNFEHETFMNHVKTKVPAVSATGTFTLLLTFYACFLRLFSHEKVCLRHSIYRNQLLQNLQQLISNHTFQI